MLEVLTHTKRRDFKNCHRYYFHRHEEHLQPRRQKRGRRKGSIFGQTLLEVRLHMDELLKLEPVESIPHRAEWLPGLVQGVVDREYDEIRELAGLTPEDYAELEQEQAMMVVVVMAYVAQYGIDQRREVQYDLPLRNPRTGKTSRAFKLGGKIDGVIASKGKHAHIVEDKLVSQIQRVMIERVELDDQSSEYVDAFIAKGWTATILYRHTRWPGINPKPAKEFKTKDNYPGETLEEFAVRLTEDIGERPEFYFDEQVVNFPTEHLDDYRQGRWQTAQDILAARRGARKNPSSASSFFYMNPSRCWEYGGCEFIPLCTKLEEARNLYVVVEDNPELQKSDEGVTSEYGPTGGR